MSREQIIETLEKNLTIYDPARTLTELDKIEIQESSDTNLVYATLMAASGILVPRTTSFIKTVKEDLVPSREQIGGYEELAAEITVTKLEEYSKLLKGYFEGIETAVADNKDFDDPEDYLNNVRATFKDELMRTLRTNSTSSSTSVPGLGDEDGPDDSPPPDPAGSISWKT